MTSSAKKKRERKKDFKKPKLKVGKARPKAANQTDTNFNAKAIVLKQQLNVDAPTVAAQFHHHVSLLSSRTDSQRCDSLAFLTTYLTSISSATTSSLPITSSSLLDKLCPLVLDGNPKVRSLLLKLLQVLPAGDIQDQVSRMLPHIRAGMTHLSKDIRMSSIDVLAWLDAVAGPELVSCRGGWYKTLECFTIMLGWRTSDTANWTASKSTIGDSKTAARIITALAEFLETGLVQGYDDVEACSLAETFPVWHIEHHRIPTKSNAYSYLNLFGPVQDEKDQMLEDREDRVRVYTTHFQPLVDAGVGTTKKEGGELGRATGLLSKVLDQAHLVQIGS